MFPTILTELVDWLNQQKFVLSSEYDDGRLNSAKDEDIVKDLIRNSNTKFAKLFKDTEPRFWYDFGMDGHIIQFKSSTCTKADNFNSKLALLYVLTDLAEDKIKSQDDQWRSFWDCLIKNRQDNNQNNYYFIVFDKLEKVFFLNSLKHLSKVQHNGSNLPFQINWKNNKNPVQKTGTEVYNQLIDATKKSVNSRISGHELMNLA